MSDDPTTQSDFDPTVPAEEREALEAIGAELTAARPVPRAAFRARLRSQLTAEDFLTWRPRRVRLTITAYAGSGLAALAFATAGLFGVGPFAADGGRAEVRVDAAVQAPDRR
jgi:hypothetical protein